ncbi:MAG: methyltransferase domain-containing protein [Candidatus Nanopelagicales bacterium]
MDQTAVLAMRCPIDQVPVTADQRSLTCESGHCFDIAKQGYVNLAVANSKASSLRSDDLDMVTSRQRFLATGAFDPIVDAVASRIPRDRTGNNGRLFVELGAGTAAYLAAALDRNDDAHGIAIDLSIPATIRAARSHVRTTAIVSDSWAPLPLADDTVDAVLVAFAPRNLAEIARVLRPGGRLVLASAKPAHIQELRDEYELLGIATKNTDRVSVPAEQVGMAIVEVAEVQFEMDLEPEQVADLILMGPNAWHVDRDALRTRVMLQKASRKVSASVGLWVLERR